MGVVGFWGGTCFVKLCEQLVYSTRFSIGIVYQYSRVLRKNIFCKVV